jgi:hypothetical protein
LFNHVVEYDRRSELFNHLVELNSPRPARPVQPHNRLIIGSNPAVRGRVFSGQATLTEESMNRHRLIVLAFAGGLATAAVPSLAQAQTGDALAYAEQTCLDYGIAPNSAAFNACVERSALAYDRGRVGLADREARVASEARNICLRWGIDPHTLGYRQCVNNEIDRRSAVTPVYRDPPYRAIAYPNSRLIYMP